MTSLHGRYYFILFITFLALSLTSSISLSQYSSQCQAPQEYAKVLEGKAFPHFNQWQHHSFWKNAEHFNLEFKKFIAKHAEPKMNPFWHSHYFFDALNADIKKVLIAEEALIIEGETNQLNLIKLDRINLKANGVIGRPSSSAAIKLEILRKAKEETICQNFLFKRKVCQKISKPNLIRLTFNLKLFNFGPQIVFDDILRKTADTHLPLLIKVKHLHAFLKSQKVLLTLKGQIPGDCPPPTPTPIPTPEPTPTPTPVPTPTDQLPPQISILSQSASGLTAQNNQLVEFEANELSNFFCSSNGISWSNCGQNLTRSSWSVSNLADGPQQLAIKATDLANNQSDPIYIQWTVDTTAPIAQIDSVSVVNNITDQNSFTMNFSANEAVQFYCSENGNSFTSCNSPLILNNLTDGNHQVSVKAIDLVGFTSNIVSYEWEVRVTVPSVIIASITPNTSPTNLQSLNVYFSGQAGTRKYLCTLDDNSLSNCLSPLNLKNLVEGPHKLSIQAIDGLGRLGPAAIYNWVIDLTPPEVFFTNFSPSINPTQETSMSVQFASSESVQFECQLDHHEWTPCQSPWTLSALAEGTHALSVRASDPAGNQSLSTADYTWTIDTTSPQISLLMVEPQGEIINSTLLKLTLNSNESVNYEYHLDAGEFSSCTSQLQLSSLNEGSHVLYIRAKDQAQNMSQILSYSFVVDTTSPLISITDMIPKENSSQMTSKTIYFIANENMARFECSLDEGNFATCASPANYQNLTDGNHSFKIRGIDLAGNISSEESVHWIVDTQIPVLRFDSIVPNNSPTSQENITLNFSSNELLSGTFCNLDSMGFAPCSSPLNVNLLTEGPHQITIKGQDLAGNQSLPLVYTWIIDKTPPILTIQSLIPSSPYIATNSLTVSFSANEEAQFFYRTDGGDFTACTSPLTINNINEGTHRLEIKARDQALNETTPFNYEFVVDVTSPETLITGINPSGNYITTNSITIDFSSNENAVIYECKFDLQNWTTCTSPNLMTNLSEGLHTLMVRAKDLAGNLDSTPAQHSFTVETTALSISNTTASVIAQTSVTLTWTTTLPASSQVEYTHATTNVSLKTPATTSLVTNHSVTVTGLTANTLYRLKAISSTPSGKSDVSPEILIRTKR